MADEAEIKEQLLQLKATTIRTGGLHEAQQFQMVRWAVLFPNSDPNQTRVKVFPNRKCVEYDIVAPHTTVDKFVRDLAKNVEEWTRYILWNDTAVVVKFNGRRIHGRRPK